MKICLVEKQPGIVHWLIKIIITLIIEKMRHKGQQRRDDKPWQSQNGANPGKEKWINSKGGKGAIEDEKAKEEMLINKKRSEKEKTMLTWLFTDKAARGETIWLWNKSKQWQVTITGNRRYSCEQEWKERKKKKSFWGFQIQNTSASI